MTTALSIRLFRLSDMDGILQIEHASFLEDAYDRNLFANFYQKCGEMFLVAAKDRTVLGYMLTCRAELVSLAVDPKHRGQGIASALMDSTLRRLLRRRIARFHLTVKVTNETAIRFYEGYGFHRSRLVPHYYEDGADGWRMVKPL
jgi:ribosomal-protein-alanine N-acetyltransferase